MHQTLTKIPRPRLQIFGWGKGDYSNSLITYIYNQAHSLYCYRLSRPSVSHSLFHQIPDNLPNADPPLLGLLLKPSILNFRKPNWANALFDCHRINNLIQSYVVVILYGSNELIKTARHLCQQVPPIRIVHFLTLLRGRIHHEYTSLGRRSLPPCHCIVLFYKGGVALEYLLQKLEQWTSPTSETGEVGIVYALECTQNWRCYIGITKFYFPYEERNAQGFRALRRFRTHLNQLNKGCHPSRGLQSDWDEYDSDHFLFKVLEVIPVFTSGSATLVWGSDTALRQLEAKWHRAFDDTYSRPSWDSSPKRARNSFAEKFKRHVGIEKDCSRG